MNSSMPILERFSEFENTAYKASPIHKRVPHSNPLRKSIIVSLHDRKEEMTNTAITGQYGIDSKAEFEIIFKQYYEGLCRYARTWIQDSDESEEIVQNVFVKLWEKREKLQIDTSLKSYLYKSVYHASLNLIKHKKVKEEYLHMNDQQNKHSEILSNHALKELEGRIEKTLLELPEQCRLIFSMSRFQELKYREIAEVLNISVKTVENQMGKALKLMRHNLADFLSLLLIIIHFIINQ